MPGNSMLQQTQPRFPQVETTTRLKADNWHELLQLFTISASNHIPYRLYCMFCYNVEPFSECLHSHLQQVHVLPNPTKFLKIT